ncbi:hemerythrin domain-containing protein [Noviherbaspirillum saxi]|uniref:Hemerythrin domain-containing protein n=1 Tax=Noviherbaspirillum saxi TaxID=2320863 RepID=A0A3A3FM88_9BURK|nr:hemerythrin domain-containing protein [Noviherbaspirillum saxi]RJF97337.1 hemerythrin domain-containing protein [Noviherbaspirillum saxi]
MIGQDTDAVHILTAQHREMEDLLQQVADSDENGRDALFARAADKLTVHIKSEEEIFYPAVNRARTEDDLLESLEEHLSLKRLLADLLEMDAADKGFEAKFKVLKEQTEHHHQEEEENLFPAVVKMIDAGQREKLGMEMLTLQDDLTEQGEPREGVADETAEAASLNAPTTPTRPGHRI